MEDPIISGGERAAPRAVLSNAGCVGDPAGSLAGPGSIACVPGLALGVTLSHQEEGGVRRRASSHDYHLVRRETAVQFNEGKRCCSDVTAL